MRAIKVIKQIKFSLVHPKGSYINFLCDLVETDQHTYQVRAYKPRKGMDGEYIKQGSESNFNSLDEAIEAYNQKLETLPKHTLRPVKELKLLNY